MESTTSNASSTQLDVKPEPVSADIPAGDKRDSSGDPPRKRKYTKRTAEEKNPKQTLSCEWKDISQHNKIVVSMNTGIFQQDVIMRQANGTFLKNFGFTGLDSAYTEPNNRGVGANKLSMNEPSGAMDLPLRTIIGDKRLTRDIDNCIPPPECPTSNRVLTNVMHAMTTGTNTSFFCTLVDSCNRPMFCHLQCVPIAANKHTLKVLKSEKEQGRETETETEAERDDHSIVDAASPGKAQQVFWAVLTIHCASQIGCAMQFGIGYGLKANQTYSEEVEQAFKRTHEINPKGGVARTRSTPGTIGMVDSVQRNGDNAALVEAGYDNSRQDVRMREKFVDNVDQVESIDNPCPMHLRTFGMSTSHTFSSYPVPHLDV